MKITEMLTDQAILAEIGQRIARHRLEYSLTQATLAEEAGVAKRTLEHTEAGANVQMSTIIRIFRVLGLLSKLDQILPEPEPRPIGVVTRRGKTRKRASSPRRNSAGKKPWTWGDE